MMSRILNSVAEDNHTCFLMGKSFALYLYILHYFSSLSISRISCCHFAEILFIFVLRTGIFSCLFLMTIRTGPEASEVGWKPFRGLPGFFLFSLMPWVLATSFPYWLYQFSSPLKRCLICYFHFEYFLTRTVFQNRLLRLRV